MTPAICLRDNSINFRGLQKPAELDISGATNLRPRAINPEQKVSLPKIPSGLLYKDL